MINVLISRCLLGENCRYDGKSNSIEGLSEIADKCKLIPVCPEVIGGLPTPRLPSEIRGGRVYMNDGKDVTENFKSGALQSLMLAEEKHCVAAILKAKSPSCGRDYIYDGTFSRTLIEADGILAGLLKKNEIRIFTEKETQQILEFLEELQ